MSGHEPQIKISIPAAASRLLGALRRAGFEAYVVGGCVRDSLLGRTPGDWDICTSARPEQVRTVFSAYRQILTGEKHGTVAVIVGGTPYEITTYRVDGQYHDSRMPCSLCRRCSRILPGGILPSTPWLMPPARD